VTTGGVTTGGVTTGAGGVVATGGVTGLSLSELPDPQPANPSVAIMTAKCKIFLLVFVNNFRLRKVTIKLR
jgi:hypothetical protein